MTATAMPTTSTCQNRPFNSFGSERAEKAAARRRPGVICGHGTKILPESSDFRRRTSTVAPKQEPCNKCFMAEPAKSSPLSELRIALPSLPLRLQEVGRFVAANDYDATTRSMRDLAAEAGADPAAFTRLAKAIGYSGWDELRAALTEARRPSQTSPFSGRAKSRRHGPNADVALVTDKLEAEAAGLPRISAQRDRGRGPRAARCKTDLDHRLSQLPQRRGIAQLRAPAVPSRTGADRRRVRPRRSRSRRLPPRRGRDRHRLHALYQCQRPGRASRLSRRRDADRDRGQRGRADGRGRRPRACCSKRPPRPASSRASPARSRSRSRWPR